MTENIGSEAQEPETETDVAVTKGWTVMTDGDKVALVLYTPKPLILLMDPTKARDIAQRLNKMADMVAT